MRSTNLKFVLDVSMPGCTSAWLFEQVHSHLVLIQDNNSKVFSPNQFAMPVTTIQTLVGGAICFCLLCHNHWLKAYNNDRELCTIHELILNLLLITNESHSKVNHNFCGTLQKLLMCIEDGMLVFREPITGRDSYICLQLVPHELYNIIFMTFHANPIGAHLNAYWTLHCIRLCFYWPSMFAYVKRMCNACPGCALSNPTCRKSSELVYRFPIKAPFLVMHFDAYWQESIEASTAPKFTSLAVAACVGLLVGNQSLTHLLLQ
jgi:hypothetical protein